MVLFLFWLSLKATLLIQLLLLMCLFLNVYKLLGRRWPQNNTIATFAMTVGSSFSLLMMQVIQQLSKVDRLFVVPFSPTMVEISTCLLLLIPY